MQFRILHLSKSHPKRGEIIMKTTSKLLFIGCCLILSSRVAQGMQETDNPKQIKKTLSKQELIRMEEIRNETPLEMFRADLRNTILTLCSDITRFYMWAFHPSTLQIKNDL